jgi:hypothetical protein
MLFTKRSPITGKMNSIEIPMTIEQLKNWQAGMLIQVAAPNLTPEQREFLITGMTPEEQEDVFKKLKKLEEEENTYFKQFEEEAEDEWNGDELYDDWDLEEDDNEKIDDDNINDEEIEKAFRQMERDHLKSQFNQFERSHGEMQSYYSTF